MNAERREWREYLAPFGIPVRLIADNPDLLATASAAYADWKDRAPGTEPAIELRLGLEAASSNHVSCGIQVEGSRLTLAGDGISGHANAKAKRAECLVPRRLVGDPAALAEEVTDTLLLFLLARSGRTPLHAAGIVTGGTALVLIGPAGAGKSSLAYAAAERGLHVLSDDTVYIQLDPVLRVWGLPRPIHLFPRDAPPGAHATRVRAGKAKLVVSLAASQYLPYADKAVLVLLERGEQPALTHFSSGEALSRLPRLDPGFDLLPAESGAAMEVLAKAGVWRLTLGQHPGAAIDLLCERLA